MIIKYKIIDENNYITEQKTIICPDSEMWGISSKFLLIKSLRIIREFDKCDISEKKFYISIENVSTRQKWIYHYTDLER